MVRRLLALVVLVAVAACGRDTATPPPEQPDPPPAADASSEPWLDALSPDHVVRATAVVHRGDEDGGPVPTTRYELEVEDTEGIPESLRWDGPDTITVVESRGVEGRPSVFAEADPDEAYVVLSEAADGGDLQLDLAFTADDGDGDVTFLGPDAEGLEAAVDEARRFADPPVRTTELALVMAVLDEAARFGDLDRSELPLDSILGRRAAAEAAADDPIAAWYATPPAERGLDPADAPPEVVARLETVRVTFDVAGGYPPHTTLALVTDEGVAIAYGLDDWSDGIHADESVPTPPGSPWQVVVTPLDGTPRTIGEVPATAWSTTGHVLIRVDGDALEARSLPGA